MNKNIKTGAYTKFNNNESELISFNFSTNLRAVDKVNFVKNVTNTIVADNFNIVIKDLIFDIQIVDVFTDIDLSQIYNANDNLSAIEDFLANTNIVDIVVANMEDGLLDELKYAVNKNIDYQTGIHDNPLVESLASLVKTFETMIGKVNVDEMLELARSINKIQDNINTDDLINAYTKTDAFKNGQKALEKERKRHNKKLENVAGQIMKNEIDKVDKIE